MKKLYFLLFLILPALAEDLSIHLKNAPISQILTYLAQESGKNIVLSDDIKGNVTLNIENSHFDEVIKMITLTHQLTLNKENNIYTISSLSKNKPQENNKDPIHILEQKPKLNTVPTHTLDQKPKLITKKIKLEHVKASEVIESLTKGQGQILSEQGYLHFDERSNALIIKDSASSIKNITEIIKALDEPLPQIAIEARIVTISSENLQELGVRWGMFSPELNTHRFNGHLEGKYANPNLNLNVNFPVSNAASAVLQVAKINSRMLDLELTALERENSVEIIASPRLVTTNKKQASIKQGTEIPYVMYNAKSEASDIEFKDAVLGLEVTPHLTKDNQILLDLLVSQNAPHSSSNSGNALIVIDKQELNTQVLAEHGQTIVLGGIFQHLASKDEDRVPVLGSIPFLKRLFSQSRDKISKRELVVFVTPYLLNTQKKAHRLNKIPQK